MVSDEGKSAAIAVLRREVGFGCPVCRSPFLTWHHFDPPWHIEQHWRAEGMIALCPICHADADEKGDRPGAYSNDELRSMKHLVRTAEDVRAHFPAWENKKSLLVRIGGCYADTSAPIFSVNEVPQIDVKRNESGILGLSMVLRNISDDVLVRVEDNWFTAYPSNIHDMVVTPKTKEVKVWITKEDVGLELSFRRISMKELGTLLERDRLRQQKLAAENERILLEQLPADQRAFFKQTIRESRSAPRQLPPGAKNMPAEIREAHLSDDPIGYYVRRWVERYCLTDDGLIPFLDFEQMAIYSHGQRIMIKNGIAGFLYYCAAFDNKKGAVNVRCPCSKCSPPC